MFGLLEVRLSFILLYSIKFLFFLNVLFDFLINTINNFLFSLFRFKLLFIVLVNLFRNKFGVVCLIIFIFFLVKKSIVAVKFIVNVIIDN